MSIADLIRSLQAAGVPPDAVLIAVEAVEKEQKKHEEIRRKARERKQRQREKSRDSHGTITGQGAGQSRPNPPPGSPLSLSPDPLPKSPLNPPTPPTARLPKVSLHELTVDHVADWLAEKRSKGRYLMHDEHFILDQFKNYCQSKGKKYADFIAGYRNAFEWERCQPSTNQPQRTKADRGRDAILQALRDSGVNVAG